MCPAHRYRLEAPAPQGFGAVAAIERDDRPAVTERVPRCRPATKVIKRAARWKCQAAFITHGAPGSAPLPRRTSAAVHVPPNRLASRTCSRKRKRGRRTRYRGVSSTRTGADTADGTTAHGGVDVGGRRSRHRRGRASDEVRRAVRGCRCDATRAAAPDGDGKNERAALADRHGPSVAVPVWLADDLVDAVALGPLRRDRSTPGPLSCTSAMSACLARTLSRRSKTAPGSVTSLPPAMATRVPFGKCARVSRSFLARWKSRALISVPSCVRSGFAHLGRELVDAAHLGIEGVDDAPEQALALVGELKAVGGDALGEDADCRAHRLDGVVAVPDVPGVVLAGFRRCAEELRILADHCCRGLCAEGVDIEGHGIVLPELTVELCGS